LILFTIDRVVAFQHPIQVVSRLTGLSPHVIRVWEKRYGAVTPERTGTNRRLYTDEEVERLRLLALATEAGHKIGIIAQMGVEDLRRLVATVSRVGPGKNRGGEEGVGVRGMGMVLEDRARKGAGEKGEVAGEGAGVSEVVREAVEATRQFQADRLQSILEEGAVQLGHSGVLHRLIGPLAQEIGILWQRGEVTAAHEHFASALIRDFLTRAARPYAVTDTAPRAVVATPAGQLHELGAVMVSAAATNLGWRTVYLGASLPAAEIAGAAVQNRARVVLLSVVYPADDAHLANDLRQLRRYLPAEVDIVVGGRSARAYGPVLREIRAIVPLDLEELSALLEEMREPKRE
jgi:DNA-binding transcriptional MerR regulator/methylmalonyl-CoA mutase cobalamin-binding subunit